VGANFRPKIIFAVFCGVLKALHSKHSANFCQMKNFCVFLESLTQQAFGKFLPNKKFLHFS
jgi:hypothetical protein